MTEFVHLHTHSEYSLLDGACRIKELVLRAKELGQTAVAVTDHGNMYSAVDFYNECKKQGIKAIIGCEVYVAQRTRFDKVKSFDYSPYHLVLLCKNEIGYKNLIKLVSAGYTEGFYNRPRVDLELLQKHSEGLICLSACLAGEVQRKLTDGDYNGAKITAETYREIFGNDYYIEIQNHKFKEQLQIIPLQLRLSRETGIPLVATNDCHYINRTDAKMQQVLMCISTNTTVDDPDAMSFPTDEFYFKSGDEMAELFPNNPEALANTVKIAEQCSFDFEFGVTKLPYFHIDGVENNTDYLREMCYDGLKKRGIESQVATERLEYELSIIEKMGYVDYFLIVWDFINYAKTNDIPVGPGRGSGGGSLCAYCIGITDIDPLKFNLLFERFLNPERVSMPDFDIDFCIDGRQRVIDYVVERYGTDRVAQIVTFGTLAARAAVRDVARALALPYQTGDTVAKLIPRDVGITISRALEKGEELKKLYYGDAKIHELVDMAIKVEGMPRHSSTHAAGVVITKEPVDCYVPLLSNDGQLVTQYTMTNLEALGLLKIDFLGLRNLTVIHNCEIAVRKNLPDFSIHNIPLDDKAVYKMLSKGQTKGVFQFESDGMTSAIMRLEPERLEDLIAVISLYRPGPMESIPTYIRNRHNPSLVRYKHPLLKDILDVTYGCIVYQEQVMQICRKLAGYSYGRADIVRRAMSKKKKDIMAKERNAFVYGEKNPDGSVSCVGAIANGVSEKLANEIFDDMTSFASYAFNKSHAAAYATVAYQTAYLKCHFYKEYMSALMTSVLDSTGKIIEYASECENSGVKILCPDINQSGESFTVTPDGISFSLLAIKSLGRTVISSIVAEREKNGRFTSLQELCTRMAGKELNNRGIEALIKSGALDSFPTNRRQMLSHYDIIMNGVADDYRRNIDGQLDLFGVTDDSDLGESAEIIIPPMEEFSHMELLAMEKETVGIYVSGHPLDSFAELVSCERLNTVSQIISGVESNNDSFADGKEVSLFVMLQGKKNFTTKSNQLMCFASFEDKTGTIEGVVFPNLFEKVSSALNIGATLFVRGKISTKEDEEPKLLLDEIVTAESKQQAIIRKPLCIKLSSQDKGKIEEVKALAKNSRGQTKLYFYFSDLKKLTELKEISGINPSAEFLRALKKTLGAENVAFKK